MNKQLTLKYPKYSLCCLLDAMGDSLIHTYLIKPSKYYKISEDDYKRFMHDWNGGELRVCVAGDIFTWMGTDCYYVYEASSKKVVSRIYGEKGTFTYYLALNV